VILSDGVVTLRHLAERDFAAYIGAFRDDPELVNLLGWERVPDEQRLREWRARAWREPPELARYEWVIADAESDALLGALMLHSVDWQNRRAETGFWVAPAARGQGALSRALALVIEWAFEVAGLERLELTALPENTVVPRIAEKFGYVYEGTMRKRNFERGRRVDLLMWGLLR
jgi:RimJ/RimL family protein N-acetyltransferase